MKIFLLLIVWLLSTHHVFAVSWVPIGELTVLGGVHNFDSSRGLINGNFNAHFSPAMTLNEKWYLLPTISTEYEGTRRLIDVLGTSTSSQQRAQMRMGVRAIYAPPTLRWRFKPYTSYSLELVKETPDEKWGQGLFDQRRLVLGGEAEFIINQPHSLRLNVEYFKSEYPNYISLESRASQQFPNASISRELAGDRVLDRDGFKMGLSFDQPLTHRLIAESSLSFIWSRFPNQRIVDVDGQFKDQNRSDVLLDASTRLSMPHEWNTDLRLLGVLELGLLSNSSNQNSYDATRGQLTAQFYNFVEWRLIPSATLIIGPVRRPVSWTLKFGMRKREYPHRPALDENGATTGQKLSLTEYLIGTSLNYPMSPRISLIFDLGRVRATSNQSYVQFYRYSYQATTALAGVRYVW